MVALQMEHSMTEALMNALPHLGNHECVLCSLTVACLFAIAVAEFVFDGWLSWMLAGACWWVGDLCEAVLAALGDD